MPIGLAASRGRLAVRWLRRIWHHGGGVKTHAETLLPALTCLSIMRGLGMMWHMVRKCFWVWALVVWAMRLALADTIQLKEKATITGKILAEKRDQVAIDVGYTVLVIPRNQIT